MYIFFLDVVFFWISREAAWCHAGGLVALPRLVVAEASPHPIRPKASKYAGLASDCNGLWLLQNSNKGTGMNAGTLPTTFLDSMFPNKELAVVTFQWNVSGPPNVGTCFSCKASGTGQSGLASGCGASASRGCRLPMGPWNSSRT